MPGETELRDIINHNFGKQLGQARPSDTTATSLYSPPANMTTRIDAIFVANNTGGAVTYRIFHDDDGTTYDQSTALYYDVSLAANATAIIEGKIYMSNASGNLAVRTSSGNALTFTAYGEEIV